MNQPVDRHGDDWDLTLRLLTDGPGSYKDGNIVHMPPAGQRFIWAHITLKNKQPVARKFNFDRCDLDAGELFYVPVLIDADAIINWSASKEPELSAGETITRKLIFAYPEQRSPTRLSCAPMVIRLPQF